MDTELSNKAKRKIQQARTNLVLDQPFFGQLVLRLAMVEDSSVRTMCTNGLEIRYAPAYVDTLSLEEVQGLLCHEVLHCANGHPWRRGDRDMKRANKAGDYAVNPVVVESRMKLPPGAVIDPEYTGKSMEEIYSLLPVEPQGKGKEGNESESGQRDPGPGDFTDAPGADQGEAGTQALASEWAVAVQQAATAAKAQGKLPGSLEKWVTDLLRPKVDWRTVLRRFMQSAAKDDYSWKLPNRRFLGMGLYLPGMYSEALGQVVVVLDVSGSMEQEIPGFMAEVGKLIEDTKPMQTLVGYCDAEMQWVETFEEGEIPEAHLFTGGGTDFRPAFDWVEAQGIKPACLVYLTDLCGSFPDHAPEYPVLWVTTTDETAPWGETVRMPPYAEREG